MSTACHEDGEILHSTDKIYSVTTEDADIFVALCDRHFDDVPLELRSPQPIEGGLDVHNLSGRPNRFGGDINDDTFSFRTMELGPRLFSISRELAQVALPKCVETLNKVK